MVDRSRVRQILGVPESQTPLVTGDRSKHVGGFSAQPHSLFSDAEHRVNFDSVRRMTDLPAIGSVDDVEKRQAGDHDRDRLG